MATLTTLDIANADASSWRVAEDLDAVELLIAQRLRAFAGEWFLDMSAGIQISSFASENLALIEAENAVNDTPGVKSVVSGDAALDPDTRRVRLSLRVETDFGDMALSQEAGVNSNG